MPSTAKNNVEGYHYKSNTDGTIAIEVDHPCPGVVTLNWYPQDFPGKKAVLEIPALLFQPCVQSYLDERTPKKT